MNYAQFVSKYNGKGIDWDGQFGNQCVDLVAQYVKEVYGIEPIYANAADWWTGFSGQVAQKFTKVANGATNVPKQGDILIYSKSTPGSGGYGHIEIFDKKTGAGRYQSFSQNWGGQYAHMVEHTDNYKYVLGWLTPKVTPTTGGQIMDTDAKVGNQYYTLRGSKGTAAERKSWIGQSYEAFNAKAVPEVKARQAGIAASAAKINALTAQVAAKDAEIAKLKASQGTGNPQDAADAGMWRKFLEMLPFVKK